ncbi:cytochrome P450 726A27 [Euphorbia lathyris]|uniref:Cytochrome P450 726A27 n=1 Tax=Euphorbia lathyris TaxID=212925 RepID=C7A27_EUPLT|nr:RecName: Full=Cytochrome P450 726A27; Short=ElCYP726A27; AltName: Full=4,5,8-trihydroxycasbene synthase; AltName: Full=4,8-dihydroxycasbene synthase; AltName: Full=4-hydroxycasbene synthase [Euphorbia lathyris]AMY98419.1 cytochrome P450 CYP726A27 [Euphorbia lathyris]
MDLQLQIPSYPIIFSFFIFIFMLIKIWKKQTQTSIFPPGPFKFPIVGNIPQLATGGTLPHHRLRDLAKIYGPIMTIQLGQVKSVVISSPETAKEVLKTQDIQFADRPLLLAGEMVLYNRKDILYGTYGDQWRQMRKICTLELLSAKRIQSFKSVREKEVESFIKTLRSKSGIPVNLTNAVFELTNTIMMITTIGQKCKNQEAVMSVIDRVSEAAAGFSVADVFPSLKFLHYLSGEKTKLQKLHKETDQILEEIISEHKANAKVGAQADNLLDVLLDLQKNGNLQVPLTNDNIKAATLEMFGAGSDTSSKTTDWAMAQMMRKPTTMKKAQEEVRRVFGENGKVEESRIQELKYLKLVVKETLRLHPAVALIPRECREKTKIDGFDIYPKTKILVNPWAIGRDPKVWNEPESFNPERFQDSPIDYKGTNFELIPFGAGKRICPGMTLGITNLELFLANLLYHFDWKFPDGITSENLDMTEAIGGAIKRKLDLELISIPYTSS